MLARCVHAQNKNLRPLHRQAAYADLRVFSLHAPEVECIGEGKARKPYSFGVKVTVATSLNRKADETRSVGRVNDGQPKV